MIRKLLRLIGSALRIIDIGRYNAGLTAQFERDRVDTFRANKPATLWRAMTERSLAETVDFIYDEMPEAIFFSSRFDLHSYALSRRQDGLVIECGVYEGKSINFIAERVDQVVYGFDSFVGLPEEWTGHLNKSFVRDGSLPPVRENVRLHKGWFEDTVPDFLRDQDQDISYLHIDADIYSSTKIVLEACRDKISPGTIIIFDEYFNYPGWKHHEHKAFYEFLASSGHKAVSFAYSGQQVGFKIL